jgi:hypothetical protein
MYKCLYNLELLILGTADTPFQTTAEPVKAETPRNYVRELVGTDVDAIMICPTAWKRPLWPSKVDPHWTTEALEIEPKYFTAELTYQDKAYFRLREYMLKGNDAVFATVDEARKIGIAPFISYRMNDHHHLYDEKAFVHPKFWKENPQYWLCNSPKADKGAIGLDKSNRFFNYIFDEVRDYYFSILEELVANYDVAGLELDFMRSPHFFVKAEIEEGRRVMTAFVKRVRDMLDSYGKKRSKSLKLSVRVPRSVEACLDAGLDVETWDKEGLVDIVNISTFFISNPQIKVDEFNKVIKNASTYGEIHFIVDQGKMYTGFDNNVSRRINKEQIYALAHDFLDRGLDGVSFFNFDYMRHHFFHEPRRLHMKCPEPPFEALRCITDKEYLKTKSKNYFLNRFFEPLPAKDELLCQLYVADDVENGSHKHAILRLETEKPCQENEIKAFVNGVELSEIEWLGELFVPASPEALPRRENLKFYKVPIEILRHGYNEISATNLNSYHWLKSVTYNTVELGLYKDNTLLD